MKNKIVQKILEKQTDENLFEFLSSTLTNSELSSLLLEVFQERVQHISPSQLLRNYQNNRFVAPSSLDPIAFLQFEKTLLGNIQKQAFEILECAPVAPLGSCSAVASVHQKKVLTALRGTEVTADVTNVLALEIAKRKKSNNTLTHQNLCATHRHLRTQKFDFEGFTPHFKILSLVSSGVDVGNFHFEIESIAKHVRVYLELLMEVLDISKNDIKIIFSILEKTDETTPQKVFEKWQQQFPFLNIELKITPQAENIYYQKFRFKIILKKNNFDHEIIDGGMVDWTQQFLQNKKERLLISGVGTEYLFKILEEKK